MALSGYFAIDGTLGANLNQTYTTADHEEKGHILGTTVQLNDNRAAIYIFTAQTLSLSCPVALDVSYRGSNSAGGYIALGSFNPGDFGWVRTSGPNNAT